MPKKSRPARAWAIIDPCGTIIEIKWKRSTLVPRARISDRIVRVEIVELKKGAQL